MAPVIKGTSKKSDIFGFSGLSLNLIERPRKERVLSGSV